ncbi:hypothetical protein P2318_05080 [Myxococcaceae bacterium GXIMD 01537]
MDPEAIETLRSRIQADLEHFEGNLPERYSIAWRAYLAALLEWQLLPVSSYDGLIDLLPAVEDDPVVEILRGRD